MSYLPRTTSARDLALMRRIDDLHLNHPFAGSRMLRDLLGQEGYSVGRRHVATMMKTLGIEALYRRPNTSRRHAAHPIYPYLLRNRVIERPNEVWAMDITVMTPDDIERVKRSTQLGRLIKRPQLTCPGFSDQS